MSKGWYSYYVFDLARHHRIVTRQVFDFWLDDIILKVPIAGVLAAVCAVASVRKSGWRQDYFYVMVVGGMIGASWLGRMHSGGYVNVLMPAYAGIAIAFGLALHWMVGVPGSGGGSRRQLLFILVCLLGLAQFGMLRYDPRRQVPTIADREGGAWFVEMVSKIEGDVLVPDHGYLAWLAGKTSCAHRAALSDVIRTGEGQARQHLIDEIDRAIDERRYAALIVDTMKQPYWPAAKIAANYDEEMLRFPDPEAFIPVTSLRTRPRIIYWRKGNEVLPASRPRSRRF